MLRMRKSEAKSFKSCTLRNNWGEGTYSSTE